MSDHAEAELVPLLDLLSRMTESIQGEKASETNGHAQTLAVKTFLHLGSVLYLAKGTRLPPLSLVRDGGYCDFASIAVLTRASLETYVAFCFLFAAPSDVDTQQLRVEAWRLSALLTRQRLPDPSPEAQARQATERPEIEQIVATLNANAAFQVLRGKDQQQILKGRWRTPYSWEELASLFAWIPDKLFKASYGLLSSYAHADYLAAMHLHQSDASTRQELARHLLVQARMVASYLIFAYAWMFQTPRGILASAAERRLAERYCLSPALIRGR